MKKKILLAVLSCILILAICYAAYAFTGSTTRKKDMRAYLENQGYTDADIEALHARCSAFSAIVDYKWWTISVEFADEPGVTYYYDYDGREISQSGIGGREAIKSELKHAEF